jgi:hypothetical protein
MSLRAGASRVNPRFKKLSLRIVSLNNKDKGLLCERNFPWLRKVTIMSYKSAIVIFLMLVAATCLAQDGLVIRTQGKQERPADADKIYISACLAVEREFRIDHPIRPRLTLVVGAEQNGAYWDPREIRLTKWNPGYFAQGVVLFAFDDLLPDRERLAVAKRALSWANATVNAESLTK